MKRIGLVVAGTLCASAGEDPDGEPFLTVLAATGFFITVLSLYALTAALVFAVAGSSVASTISGWV